MLAQSAGSSTRIVGWAVHTRWKPRQSASAAPACPRSAAVQTTRWTGTSTAARAASARERSSPAGSSTPAWAKPGASLWSTLPQSRTWGVPPPSQSRPARVQRTDQWALDSVVPSWPTLRATTWKTAPPRSSGPSHARTMTWCVFSGGTASIAAR
jgi:hypothetical protein